MTTCKKEKFKRIYASRIMIILLLSLTMLALLSATTYAESCPKGGEHDYSVKLVKQASNTEDGLRIYTCKKCGNSYDEVIQSFGHEWSEWSVKVAPECNKTGIKERHCVKCGESEERRIESLGHDYRLTKEQDASCTESGYRDYECGRCGHGYEKITSPALGHDWGEWEREGDKEVRVCGRNPNHRQERPVGDKSDEHGNDVADSREERDKEKEALIVGRTDDAPPNGSKSAGNSSEWTGANTAVAAGGAIILAALGAVLFTRYITPWLWVIGKRRKKREEMQRRVIA